MKHLCLLLLVMFSSLAGLAQKKLTKPALHMLYVMEQEDPQYGLLNLRNEELMNQIMSTVNWALDYTMTTTYLVKKNFTSTALKKAITSLKTGPQDIVVLYYSGFGLPATTPTSKFANWKLRDMSEQGLPVDAVEQWLVNRKVHLGLILADCSGQRMEQYRPDAILVNQRFDPRIRTIRGLFLNTCGIVKLGSSLPTLPSWANDAYEHSLFTGALWGAFNELLKATNEDASRSTFQYVNRLTAGLMQGSLGDIPFRQVPVLEIKPCVGSAQPVISPSIADTLTDEDLNGLLTAVALNKDPLQRTQLIKKLRLHFREDAIVDANRLFSTAPLAMALVETNVTYPFNDYIGQLQLPQAIPEGFPMREVPVLKILKIKRKEMDTTVPGRIKRIAVQERWYPDR